MFVYLFLQVYDTNGYFCIFVFSICVFIDICTQPILCSYEPRNNINSNVIRCVFYTCVVYPNHSVQNCTASIYYTLLVTKSVDATLDFYFENDSHYFHTPFHTAQHRTAILLSFTLSYSNISS